MIGQAVSHTWCGLLEHDHILEQHRVNAQEMQKKGTVRVCVCVCVLESLRLEGGFKLTSVFQNNQSVIWKCIAEDTSQINFIFKKNSFSLIH